MHLIFSHQSYDQRQWLRHPPIYSEVAVKAGRVITTGMEQDFFTSADIGAFWGNYDYEVTTASEDELPALYE